MDTAAVSGFLDKVWEVLMTQGVSIGLKLLGGIILWIVGKWIISFTLKLVARAMESRKVDSTLTRYVGSALKVLLMVALVVAILGFFGVETTTFAALLAGAGLAIGTAWGGLLTNFAAGAFLIVLRPFKAGDFVSAGGVIGTVKEVGMFVTVIDTMDNVQTIIGNNKIFSETIQNFTANPYRRVDLVAQLSHGADVPKAIELLRRTLMEIDGVQRNPAPSVELLEFNLAGPKLAVRPFCHNDVYWDVYFKTNECIRKELGNAGFAVPEQHYQIRNAA